MKIPGLLLVEGSEERRSNNYTGVLKEIELEHIREISTADSVFKVRVQFSSFLLLQHILHVITRLNPRRHQLPSS